jgi:hypothetical protein
MSNGVKWYYRGEMGQWLLDHLEVLANDDSQVRQDEVAYRLTEIMSAEEAREEVRMFIEEG